MDRSISHQREPSTTTTMEPSPTNVAARRAQQMPTKTPTLDTVQPAIGAPASHKIHYLEEGVQEDANYQVQWRDWMSDGQKKSFYKQVSVLLLSWHPECDDMAVGEEVQGLESVLSDTYNYKVESFVIDSRQKVLPQIQANRAVANFVAENDEEDTLFIVYYAGHGSPGKDRGDLKMSARRRQETLRLDQQFSHITWNLVESNLKTTRADVFLIFDCCHASDLGRESDLNSRSFEYLAASTSTYTRSPGEGSFTRALIWALENLALPSSRAAPQSSPMFTTSKLAKMICDAPGFPQDQKPSLTTRDVDAWQHIILAPLPREGVSAPAPSAEDDEEDKDVDEEDKSIPQSLFFIFHFKAKPDEAELKKLADYLKKFVKLDITSLHKVQWGGIWGAGRISPGHRFREAVGRVMAQTHLPTSKLKNLTFPSNPIQSDRLSPQRWDYSSGSPTERTPLLSDASSDTFEPEATTQSIWSRIFSFFRTFWWKPTSVEHQEQPNSTPSNSGRKTSKRWTSRLKSRLRVCFTGSLPRIQVSS